MQSHEQSPKYLDNNILVEKKRSLRRQMLACRAELSSDEVAESDQLILRQLLDLREYKYASMIFCYVSTAEEVDTRVFIKTALSHGKRVCVPLCLGKGEMIACEITDLGALKPGKMGILEPRKSQVHSSFNYCGSEQQSKAVVQGIAQGIVEQACNDDLTSNQHLLDAGAGDSVGGCTAVVSPQEIDLVIVPCVAADKNDYRLGYGGGYYDRYLAQFAAYHDVRKPFVVALCRSACVLATLPIDKYDLPTNLVISG